MSLVSWSSAASVIGLLQQIPTLQSRFYVAGGLVPWLIAQCDSGRMHSDIDLVVAQHDMPLFRDEMQRRLCYNPATDSQSIWSHLDHDYGFDVILDGVYINIAPFESLSSGIVQRNATYSLQGDQSSYVELTIPKLSLADYVTHTRWCDQLRLGHYPLALVYATKRITQRPKDQLDCDQMDRLGVEPAHIMRYSHVLQQMSISVGS